MSPRTEAVVCIIGIVLVLSIFVAFTHWFAAHPLPYHVDWP